MKVVVDLNHDEVEALRAATVEMTSATKRQWTGAEMAGWLLRDALIGQGFLKLSNKDRGPGARRS